MFTQEIKIPKERVAVLIGKKGEVKRAIEEKLNLKMNINSETGDVILTGEDSLNLYLAKSVVQAIARGFNPEIALGLIEEENILEVIDIKDYSKKSKAKMFRLRSRIIGTKGRARKTIEDLTNTAISIYGKTITIIGKVEDVLLAKQAIENLLRGSPHGNVYRWIEKKHKK